MIEKHEPKTIKIGALKDLSDDIMLSRRDMLAYFYQIEALMLRHDREDAAQLIRHLILTLEELDDD